MQGDIEGLVGPEKETKIRKRLIDQATVLRKFREKTAYSARVADLLGALGFKKARLEIEIVDEPELGEHGDCRCRFLFFSECRAIARAE